jgi:general secretion pathway protein J
MTRRAQQTAPLARPRRARSLRRRIGMTLIEVMVAMTMFAVVGALVYGGFSQTARAKKTLEAQLNRYHELRMAMERMVRELSMAYVSTHLNLSPSLQGMRTTFIGKDSSFGDRIDFTSVSHTRIYRDAKESDQNELSYFVTDDPSDDGKGKKVLARRMSPRIDSKPEEGGRVEVLLTDVVEFELEYLDSASWEWVKEWDAVTGIGQQNRLPTQVKIKLTVPSVANPDKKETYVTRAVLPMNWALNHAKY